MKNRIFYALFPEPVRHPLTKGYLLKLPTGKYLTTSSGAMVSVGVPSFAEIIAPLAERERQWRRIVLAGANGRMSMLFQTPADFKQWFERWFGNRGAQN